MAYETFPSITGSSVVEEGYEIEDPVIETEFENGWIDARSLRSRPRFVDIRVTYTVDATDKDTILNFLVSKRLRAIPFLYPHDKLGTILVRLAQAKLPVAFEVLGDPVWYKLSLVFEEQF
jgi:hypothetical protein